VRYIAKIIIPKVVTWRDGAFECGIGSTGKVSSTAV
jgi:hypothetical protein